MSSPEQKMDAAALHDVEAFGAGLRARRKELGLTAVAVAEASGISRVTLHRIEAGSPSVAMGFYVQVARALGLALLPAAEGGGADAGREGSASVPTAIRVADFPELERLAWHVKSGATLRPREVLGIYERNRKHLDEESLAPAERQLLDNLREAWGEPDV